MFSISAQSIWNSEFGGKCTPFSKENKVDLNHWLRDLNSIENMWGVEEGKSHRWIYLGKIIHFSWRNNKWLRLYFLIERLLPMTEKGIKSLLLRAPWTCRSILPSPVRDCFSFKALQITKHKWVLPLPRILAAEQTASSSMIKEIPDRFLAPR